MRKEQDYAAFASVNDESSCICMGERRWSPVLRVFNYNDIGCRFLCVGTREDDTEELPFEAVRIGGSVAVGYA